MDNETDFKFDLQLFAENEDKKTIDSPEKLQEWVDNTDSILADLKAKNDELETEKTKKNEEIVNLKKEVSDIGDLVILSKNSWKETDEKKKADYELGKWFARWRLGFHKYNAPGNDVQGRSIERLLSKGYKPLTESIKADHGEIEKTGLGTPLTGDSSGTNTQYLMPAYLYETEILRTADLISEVMPLFTRKRMTNRLIRYPVESNVAGLTFVTTEVTDKTESNPTWTYVDLSCETFATWVAIIDELLEDTFTDIGAAIRVQVLEDYIKTVEDQMFEGSGSPFTGILNETTAKVYSMTSTSIDDLSWDDMQWLIEKLTERKYRLGAVFMMHPTIWDLLCREQNAVGSYLWLPTTVVPRMCRGYPVKLSDNMPTASEDSSEKAFIVFGNPKWMWLGLRIGLEFRYFDQTYYAVQNDENFWRARTRFGTKIAIPTNYAVLKTGA